MKKKLVIILLISLIAVTAFAQKKIKGTILNAENQSPMSGVSIHIKGDNNGTVSDSNGEYEIQAPDPNAILVFSYFGFKDKEIKRGTQTTISVQLQPAVTQLDEVVSIGYRTAKKSDLTGSVASLNSRQLLDRPVGNVSQALQGKVAGLYVSINTSAPGEPAMVLIRGIGSINSSIAPLYVVDGVIGVNVNNLNPNDIESVEVLKDASATAIYGARGANGIILITTKRGVKGEARISYDAYVSLSTLQRHLHALNSEEFMKVYGLAYKNTEKYDPLGYSQGKYIPNDPKDFPRLFDADGKPLYNTNWESEVFKPFLSTSHQLTLQGGGNSSIYSLSLGYLDQNGLMIHSGFNRYSARFSFDNDVKKWLKIGGSIGLIKSKERMVSDDNGGLNVPRMVIEGLPIIPVKYPDGSWGGNSDFPRMEGGSNPVEIATNRYTLENILQSVGDVYTLIHITPNLDFKSSLGFDVSGQKNNFYSGRGLHSLSLDQKGIANISNWMRTYWQSENYLTWNKQISTSQKLTALLGLSWQKYDEQYDWAGAENFIDDYWAWHNLGAGTNPRPPASSDYQWQMNSYFAGVTYNINEKYLFTLTGRYDGSSKFGKNNKYAFFLSIGAAWRLSEENFLKDSRTISYMKLRASYGSACNQEIGTYNSIQLLGSGTTIFDDQRQPTISRSSFGNPDLKGERINQADVGMEIGLWNNRLYINADYYYKVTSNLLLNAPISWTSGLSSAVQNIGSVENQGFEAAITSQNIKSPSFNWSTNLNFASNKNKILHLGEKNDDIYPGPWFLGQTNILRVGWPIGTFWGYIREGVWGTDEKTDAGNYGLQPGDLKWKDLNNDGKIDDNDLTRLGNAYPKWTMTISNTFNYKNFDFSFAIRFVEGVNTVANFRHSAEDRQGIANSLATVLDAWTPENKNSMIAEVRYYGSFYQTHIDSWWVEDGSFIRGENFTLGYIFPVTLIIIPLEIHVGLR